MRPKLRLASIIALVLIAILLLWELKRSLHLRRSPSQLRQQLQSAVANTEGYVKRHMTGGVGAVLTLNGNGFPCVQMVLMGSPAEMAGLRAGDVITEVNDAPIVRQDLKKAVESIRGFTGGHVKVTVQRGGSTNLTFFIQRSSWDGLGLTNIFDTPTNAPPIIQIMPRSTNAR